MEGLGAEVTQKIKSAIQAKLMELGAYVDDELPDYVMVMVGNKRSKSQMENDLQLFLGNNTVPFTSWLYQVLQKLQEVTVANKNKNVKPIKKERTPSFEDDDFINIAETDGDLLEDELPSKKKETEKTVKTKSDKPSEKSVVYLPSKIRDRKTSEDDAIEKKIDKVNKETNTVVKKRVTHDESSSKKSSVNEYVRSNREETNNRREDVKDRRNSRLAVKEKANDKVVFDARELLNRKKAEKLASKDVSKQNDHVKKKRDHSPDDRHSSKRSVSRVNDADALNRWVNASKDNEQERNGREKDGGLKSTIHRTSLKRKVSVDEKNDEKSERYKEDKRSDNARSSKVIRISETLQAEQELIKPRNSSKTVISGPERKSLHSRIAAPNETSRDSERERERESGVSSVVRITPRPKRPASQQPSSSLILKAVAEANKSLAAAPARPISTSNRHLERPLRGKISPDKITVTLPNHRIQPLSKDETSSYNVYSNMDNGNTRLKEDDKELTKGSSQNSLADGDGGHYSTNASCSTIHSRLSAASDKGKSEDAINQWLKGVEDADPMKPVLDSFSSQETDLDSEPILEICQNMSELEPEEEPEFVVTLHGLDPDMFPKMNENEEEIDSDGYKLEECHEDNVDNGLVSGSEEVDKNKVSPPLSPKETPEKKLKRNSSPIIIVKQSNTQGNSDISDGVKLKSLERCKYWPSCLLGDKCSFHHPSTPCNTFPACKYGDNCLFIHPSCKFGISCTRRDCPYAHSTPVIAGIPKIKVNPLVGALQYCRFYPNCTNVNCQFYHPKPCRFGRYCAKKDCPFEHKKGPSKDKLKWTRVQTTM